MSKNRVTPRRRFLTTVAAAAASYSAAGSFARRALAAPSGKPIVVGFQGEITGLLAFHGNSIQKGLDAAVAYINDTGGIAGRPLKVVTRDTQGKVDVGLRRLQQLVHEDNVDFIIGSEHGGISLACAPLVKDLDTIFVTLSRTDKVTTDLASRYIYRPDSCNSSESWATAPWAVKNLGKKWATITADYAWGQGHRDAWSARVKAAGGEVLQNINLPINTPDPVTYVAKIDRSVDGLFFAFWGVDAVRVLPTLKDLGLGEKYWFCASEMIQLFDILKLGKTVEGLWSVNEVIFDLKDKDTPANRNFRKYAGVTDAGRDAKTGDALMLSDVYFAWEYLGFIKTAVEGSGWQSRKDNQRFISWTDTNPSFREGMLFPRGGLYLRPQDHQGFCDLYISQIHDGRVRLKTAIPKEETMYPIVKT